MPRIDHEDDFDDSLHEDDDAPRGGVWRRRILTTVLALIGLGLGFLIPYMLYLNQQISQRFSSLQWQVPTRVYAQPLTLAPGRAMDAKTLKTELAAAGYREDGTGERAGTYAVDGGRWRIASRGFDDVDGKVAPSRVEVLIASGQVSSVKDLVGGGNAARVRLDPARIATLYGQQQEERRLVQLNEVPELLVTGLQAVEDKDFARHHGIDMTGIVRAALVNIRAGEKRQGASTITQQLARSGLLGIGIEQTWSRKINEILYAIILELRYDKHTILETYFNQVYMGQRGSQAIHGVAAASDFWFGRDMADLSTEQMALLIGIVRGPSYYDPRRNPERATERRNFVIDRMAESGLIDAAEQQRAKDAPLALADGSTRAANRFPAYVDLVRRQLARDYPAGQLQGAGLTVMTGMSPSAQGYTEAAVNRTMQAIQTPRRPELQTGVVVTDVHTGMVVAVVGSRDVAEHGFNRAVEAKRPVGSLLKPFVYLLALAQPSQYSLASWVDDSPVTVTLGNGRNWTPGNANGRSHGSVRLTDSLAMSYNQATVRLGMQVRPQRLAELIKTLAGVDAPANPSLILGSVDESPYAMAQLYQFLASGGQIQPLHAVRGVLDEQGRALHRYDAKAAPAQAGDAIAARLITLSLQHAVSGGTGRQLLADGLGRLSPAGKTGTSNDGRDSWFAGWTGDYLAVAWVGNDANESTGLYGATGAMRIWSGLFSRLPSRELKVAEQGIEWQWVSANGATESSCPGARRFAFVAGYAPTAEPCYRAPPPSFEEFAAPADGTAPAPNQPEQSSGWRQWFGGGQRNNPSEQDPARRVQPPAQPAPVQ